MILSKVLMLLSVVTLLIDYDLIALIPLALQSATFVSKVPYLNSLL